VFTFIRGLLRLVFFAFGSLLYIFRYLAKAAIMGYDLDRVIRLRGEWFRISSKVSGVRIESKGVLPAQAGLIVCNHRSYFDPLIILMRLNAVPVGKIEMKKWPIIGWGAQLSGVIFVPRASKTGSGRARKSIVEHLQKGYSIINYPEGTTHDKPQTIAFKMGLFKDASAIGFPVYPVAIEYKNSKDAFIGDDTFVPHFIECFGKHRTYVSVSYGKAINGDDPKKIMQQSKQWIDTELLEIREKWGMPIETSNSVVEK